MELLTTVRDFAREASYRRLAPETHIRVIIDEREIMTNNRAIENPDVPAITPEEQRCLLNLLPQNDDPQASEELIHLIETSHVNTEPLHL